jgi:MFS family permease
MRGNPQFLRTFPIGLAVALSLFGDLSLFAGLVTQLGVVHLSLGEVGIILSVHRLVRIPGNLVVGELQDRFGRSGLFGLGMLLAVVSTAAYGLVSGFWPFVLARVAWGAAWALINVCGTTMVLDLSSPADRGSLAGFYGAWVWVGYFIGPLVGGLLTDALSFQRAMLICSALSAIGFGVSLLFVRETRAGHKTEIRSFSDFLGAVGLKNLRSHFSGGRQLSRIYLVFAAVQFAGDGVVLATLTLLLTERLGQVIPLGSWQLSPVAAGGIFIAGRAALAAFVSLGAGRLSDGLVHRPLLLWLSLWVAVLGAGLLALAASTGLILLGLGLNALSNGTALAVLPALVRDHSSPEDLGRSMGSYAMAGDIGSTAGPALAFALAPSFGLGVVYGLCVLLFAGSLRLAWLK